MRVGEYLREDGVPVTAYFVAAWHEQEYAQGAMVGEQLADLPIPGSNAVSLTSAAEHMFLAEN